MSTTINSIEVTSLKYTDLRQLVNKQPVNHLEEVPFGDFQLELDLVDEVTVSVTKYPWTMNMQVTC